MISETKFVCMSPLACSSDNTLQIRSSLYSCNQDDTYYLCVLAGRKPWLWMEGVVRECWEVDEERDGGDVIYVYVPTLSPP